MFAISDFELRILDLIQEKLSCGFLDTAMPKLTSVGNVGIIWIIAAVLLMIRKKYRRSGIELSAALLGCALVVNLILKKIKKSREKP